MSKFKIPPGELDDWLNELKPYQTIALKKMMDDMEPEEAAKNWITASGSQNIVSFGGTRDKEPFWDRFKEEFNKFLCDKESYTDEKEELKSEGELSRTYLIGAISAAIGANIGYAATLLAPAVAIMLCTVGKMSLNAYCKGQKI